MKRRTLIQLFLVDFVIFLTGMGLLPLLPIYAQRFGADAADVGFYLAITYAAITAGTLLSARLASLVGHKKLFIGAGSLGVPSLILLGQAAQFWQIVALTALIWFSGGVGLALVNVFTGLFADKKARGKSFSLTYLSMPLASLVAGISVGQLIEWQGYPFMFAMLALAWAAWPVMGVAGLGSWPVSPKQAQPKGNRSGRGGLGKPFAILLLATLSSTTTVYLLRLAISYSMHALAYAPGAISGTSAVGGLVTIPLTYAIGSLSDRFGRKRFLISGYMLGGLGALVLIMAGQLWHFWLATALIFMSLNAAGSVAPALASDLLSLEKRGRGLPYLGSMRNIAGIIGFASGGLLIDKAGIFTLYLIAAALSVAATLLISRMRAETGSTVTIAEDDARTSGGRQDLALAPVIC
jgi:MFS family permease